MGLGIQNLLYELKSFLIAVCWGCKSQGSSKYEINLNRKTPPLPPESSRKGNENRADECDGNLAQHE